MKYTIKNEEIIYYNNGQITNFPKYTTQILNLANQNAQGTRPKVVGQLSELFPKYVEETQSPYIPEWKEWYEDKHPKAISDATDKIYDQIQNLKDAIKLIDKDMVELWVADLVINKTYNGLYFQKVILAFLAEKNDTEYRLATPEEESQGIDGYVGSIAYSIKPDTYKVKSQLSETINVKMIYYNKTKTGLVIEVEK